MPFLQRGMTSLEDGHTGICQQKHSQQVSSTALCSQAGEITPTVISPIWDVQWGAHRRAAKEVRGLEHSAYEKRLRFVERKLLLQLTTTT